jgi:hypothetical protein
MAGDCGQLVVVGERNLLFRMAHTYIHSESSLYIIRQGGVYSRRSERLGVVFGAYESSWC